MTAHARWLTVLALCAAGARGDTLSPAQGLFKHLSKHCGEAYAGVIERNEPADPADPFVGKSLVMHVRDCKPRELRIPFHAGDDHSRTWVLTQVGSGLRLKHDHRHADGRPDALTRYGGQTVANGSALRQEFPADAESQALFEAEGRPAAKANVWALELDGASFVYELRRPGRLFRVRFDLTQPVPSPPPPWGATPDAGRDGAPAGH